jgi:hypothetical protein
MTTLLCGWLIIVSAATVGCARTSDGTGANVDTSTGSATPATAPPPSGLPQRVSFGQVEMELPENWGVYAIGNAALVGILAGGNCDVPLRVEIHYDKDIDSLAPTCCPHHPPVEVTAVRTVESGFRPVGDKTAQFRRFSATCADQTIERRAWLLPDSEVAVVEQDARLENDLVVKRMRVGTLKDVVFANVTFHLPPSSEHRRRRRHGSHREAPRRRARISADGHEDLHRVGRRSRAEAGMRWAGQPPIAAGRGRRARIGGPPTGWGDG